MEKIIDLYRRHPVDKIHSSGDLIVRTFHNEMKQSCRIPPSMVKKFQDDILFMVDKNFTYIEVVDPRMLYVEPLNYEIKDAKNEGYVKTILKSNNNEKLNRFET